MLLLKCCLVLALVSSTFSKLDLNFHLDEVFDKLNANNETFTWGTFNRTLKTVFDSLLMPNLVGLYNVHKKIHISSECYESLHGLVMNLRNGGSWAFKKICPTRYTAAMAVDMSVVVLIILTFPLICGSSTSNMKINESNYFTWEKFHTSTKSGAEPLFKISMPFLWKSLTAANVTSNCEYDIMMFVTAVMQQKRWAINMIDASGKIPSGILDGTIMDLGSFDQCLKIKVNDSSKYSDGRELFRGQYCMIGYQSPLISPLNLKTNEGKSYMDTFGNPPEWAREILLRSGNYLNRIAFWFGACVPSTCSADDILKISSSVTKSLGFKVFLSDCQVDEPFKWPSYSIAAASCLGTLATLCVIGTLCDIICRWRNSNPTNREDDHLLLRVPKAFSILANTENLFARSVGGGSLTCFNGIRFLSATWIVLGHTYWYTDTWKYLKYRNLIAMDDQFSGHLPTAVIENFTVPVGSFFFMSGFLLVYTTWNVLEKTQGKLNLLMFLIHKFWRMTPALGLTLALFFWMPVIDSGPLWNSTLNPELENCRKFWWASFLYINNWWGANEICLLHTWYIAALMQFHIIGILLLLVVFRWRIFGMLLGSVITVACITMTTLLVIWNDFPMPAPGMIKDMDVMDDYNSKIYIKSYTHFTSYLIGMVMAYIFLKYHNRKIAPKYQVIGWICAVVGALSSVYGLYGPAESVAVRALYITGFRIGWAMSLAWMTYACATGIGGTINRLLSWNAMYSLGQLSYLLYLIHPLVIIYKNASLRERVYYGHTEIVSAFLSNLVISLFLAFLGFVMVETPFAILEKIIFKRKSKESFKKMEYKDDPQVTASGVKSLSP